MTTNLVEIIPDLWIGTDKDALKTINFMNINCSKDLSFLGKSQQYNNEIRINLEKYELIKLFRYICNAVDIIYNNIRSGNKILIHCEDCIQKSPTLTVAYLIKYGKYTKKDAVNVLKSKFCESFKDGIKYNYILDQFENKFLFNKNVYKF